MTWVKLDDQFFRHPKILALPSSPRLLYIAGLCYSSSQLTDGTIPKSALHLLALEAGAKPSDAAKLVAAGLWITTDDGWTIHNYVDHQRSKDDVDRIREQNRQRKAKARDRVRQGDVTKMSQRDMSRGHADSHADVTGLETETETETDTEPVRGNPLAREDRDDPAPLKDLWLHEWKISHAGQDPPPGWQTSISAALAELTDPRPDLERIVAAHAREGKHPKNLVFVRNDFYAERTSA